MARDYGISSLSAETYDALFADMNPEPKQITGIQIGSGQNLTRGTMLGLKTADSKYYKYNKDASDGTENLKGILVDDVDASSSDEYASMYVMGSFNKDKLTATSSVISAGMYNNNGIVIVESEVTP